MKTQKSKLDIVKEIEKQEQNSGRFVVAGYNRYDVTDSLERYHSWIAYSTDGGKIWTPSETTSNEGQTHVELHALAYGGGRFVVAGWRYDNKDNHHPWIAYSTDGGKTWTPSETTSNENQPHGLLHALAYGGGRFVVAGFRYGMYSNGSDSSDNYHPWIAYSTDGGKTWTPSETTSNENQPHGLLRALAYGGGRFVVAGFRYDISGDRSDNYHPWIAYSTDGGKTWTPNKTTSNENQLHGELYALAYGGGRFVVTGYRWYDGEGEDKDEDHLWIAYSTDGGKTWTPNKTTSNENQLHGRLYALAYGGGRFVVAGYRYDINDSSDNYHPWIAYSTDGGKTWTPSETTSNENQPHGCLRAIAYAPDYYCWKFEKEKEEEKREE